MCTQNEIAMEYEAENEELRLACEMALSPTFFLLLCTHVCHQ